MGGCDPDGPRTRNTSCAISSWNVPKLIFGEGETEKVSPKIVSPNKEAVFFIVIFFLEMEYGIKCHQIGMDQKVSPNNNNNGDNFYLIDIV